MKRTNCTIREIALKANLKAKKDLLLTSFCEREKYITLLVIQSATAQ